MTAAARPLPAAFADLTTPEQVGAELTAALAALLHRGLCHAGAIENCAECQAGGSVLAPAIASALFACRRRGCVPLSHEDYDAVGRALERLEQLARSRA